MAKKEQQELSEESVARITRVVHSMTEDQVERGVDLGRAMQCDSCGLEKPAAGSALYGAYKLCNDCLLDFTLELASGRVDSVAEFMMRESADSEELPPTASLSDQTDRTAFSRRQLPGRDKLRPSNEPV